MELRSTKVVALVILTCFSQTKGAAFQNGTNDDKSECAVSHNVTILYKDFSRWSNHVHISTKASLSAMTTIVSLASIASNSLIIHSVRINPHMRTTTNYFIVNMACADLITTLIFAPFIIKYNFILFGWFAGVFGEITCVAYQVIVLAGGACSVFSLVLISFDRLMAISRPLKYKTYVSSSKYLIMLTWLLSFALSSPFVFSRPCLISLPNNVLYCLPEDVSDLLSAMIFVFLAVLSIVIILCVAIGYKLCTRKIPGEAAVQHTADRTSRKVTCMVLCVVLAFFVTWSPLNVINFAFNEIRNLDSIVKHIIMSITYAFSLLNGVFNMAVYYIFSENYRKAFQCLFIRFKSMFRRKTTSTDNQSSAEPTGVINMAALQQSD